MSTMFDDKVNQFEVSFKNADYLITMFVETPTQVQQQTTQTQLIDRLYLEIEEKLTAERWKGVFDSTYIEDLTRKTGNFKQFLIFINMLETALNKTSDAVSLELFTYNDLEQLRNNKKSTSGSNTSLLKTNNSTNSSLTSSNINNTKRYLILTYNVEFDRIHYPLQLNYQGKPDPALLQDVIRKLKAELKLYRTQPNNITDVKRNDIIKMQKDYERVLKEKEALELQLLEANHKIKQSISLTTNDQMQKEVKMLKQMIKNIEEDSLKEKSNYQKQIHKKTKENNQLLEEIDEIKSIERNLRHQIKSLQHELSVYRRGRVFNSSNTNIDSTLRKTRSRESSRENSLTRSTRLNNSNGSTSNKREYRSVSRESQKYSQRVGSAGSLNGRNGTNSARNSLTRLNIGSGVGSTSLRSRSTSRDRDKALLNAVASGIRNNRSRSNSYDRLSKQNGSNNNLRTSNRVKTPSPAHSHRSTSSSRRRKFNPTDYVNDKQRKLEENELKRQREINRKMNLMSNRHDKLLFNSKNHSNGKIRTPSVSSINSGADSDVESTTSYENGSKRISHHVDPTTSSWSSSVNHKLTTTISSTPNNSVSANAHKTRSKHKTGVRLHQHHDNEQLSSADDSVNIENDTEYNFYNREKEIKDIDARLKSLQLFMKNNMP